MSGTDHFSRQAAQYQASRPGYPTELFAFLAALTPARDLALDCATGNGQAAWGLAAHFDKVIATDLSAAQLVLGRPHPRVHYAAATAERLPIADRSVDLVAVAQALHWFDLPAFYAEIGRIARPGAVVAAWSYGLTRVAPEIDQVVARLYTEIVGAYWPPERLLVESGYPDLPFPFEPIATPTLGLRADWPLERLLGYLASWSAVQRYKDAIGTDPLRLVRDALGTAWGDAAATRSIHWPLVLRVGRAPL
jgi:SAM-dependent methyltransferase